MAKHYKELDVWKKSMELVKEVYRCTAAFPKSETFGLASQLRRAAVSIPSNIAEGQGRSSRGEFRQFLGHARGSLFEVETQLLIAGDLSFIDGAASQKLADLVAATGRLLNGLIRAIRSDK